MVSLLRVTSPLPKYLIILGFPTTNLALNLSYILGPYLFMIITILSLVSEINQMISYYQFYKSIFNLLFTFVLLLLFNSMKSISNIYFHHHLQSTYLNSPYWGPSSNNCLLINSSMPLKPSPLLSRVPEKP